jgi:hypothetical protein
MFCRPDGRSIRLYRHQEEAISTVHAGESIVVTSGCWSEYRIAENSEWRIANGEW